MSAPTLVVMAAGIGSRYGGLKQVDPIGPSGEIIIDYSLFDAVKAGFERVVFVIKPELEANFRERIGRSVEKVIDTRYAFQQVDDLPAGYTVPEGRVKPWGTGHAVLAARAHVDGPFAVINGDDFYGAGAFQAIGDFLRGTTDVRPMPFAMVGYPVENTLTEHGHVARGVCEVDAAGRLVDIVERTRIELQEGAIRFTEDGQTWSPIAPGTPVSMNMWGFTAGLMAELEARFPAFLDEAKANPLKAEYFLPFVVNALLKEGQATVQVLPVRDRWFGVTYQEDKPRVKEAIAALVADGTYPAPLWEK